MLILFALLCETLCLTLQIIYDTRIVSFVVSNPYNNPTRKRRFGFNFQHVNWIPVGAVCRSSQTIYFIPHPTLSWRFPNGMTMHNDKIGESHCSTNNLACFFLGRFNQMTLCSIGWQSIDHLASKIVSIPRGTLVRWIWHRFAMVTCKCPLSLSFRILR
jgi:hypothetical protein